MNLSLEVNHSLALLRSRFAEQLPNAINIMQQMAYSHSEQDLRQIINEAHKLSGSCGTFGLPQLGPLARQIQEQATEVQNKTADSREQAAVLLQQAIQEFAIAVEKAINAKPDNEATNEKATAQAQEIWLVLNDTHLLEQLAQQLTTFGHTIQIFTSYAACLQAFANKAPAALFVDILLPDGSELFQQRDFLSALAKHEVKIITYTERDSFDLRIKAAQCNAEGFFISPLDVPNIIAALNEALESHKVSAGRVAIVDDDALLAEHYALLLNAAGITTHIVADVASIVTELLNFQPDIVLMDMYMPKYSGSDISGVLRQYAAFKRVPIVFLSSEQNKALQVQALTKGGDEFLTKPINDLLLVQTIKIRLARSREIRDLIEKDGLTGLIKHIAIKEAAEREFQRAKRNNENMSIVMLDIDHFKKVNDTYGHAMGDVVISTLATLLRKRIRATDKAGRYGGEEFMLLLPNCDKAHAKALVESILEGFRAVQFRFQQQQFTCTFSAGVATTNEQDFANAAAMIEAADQALYSAKRGGRNQVQ